MTASDSMFDSTGVFGVKQNRKQRKLHFSFAVLVHCQNSTSGCLISSISLIHDSYFILHTDEDITAVVTALRERLSSCVLTHTVYSLSGSLLCIANPVIGLKLALNSVLTRFEAEINLSIGLEPNFGCSLSFGSKLWFKTKLQAKDKVSYCGCTDTSGPRLFGHAEVFGNSVNANIGLSPTFT